MGRGLVLSELKNEESLSEELLLYWSTIAYARWWLSVDAPLRGLVSADDNRLTAETMALIALPYNVARGLPSRSDRRASANVAAALNEGSKGWPTTLIHKADRCRELANQLRLDGYTYYNQVSAVSKLMWFLKPSQWTLFDRYAADGMKTKKHIDTVDRMMSFFQKLDASGFSMVNEHISFLVSQSEWSMLPSERVLDTFLMRRGGLRTGNNSVRALNAFLSALPGPASDSLNSLAMQIQSELGNNILTP